MYSSATTFLPLRMRKCFTEPSSLVSMPQQHIYFVKASFLCCTPHQFSERRSLVERHMQTTCDLP